MEATMTPEQRVERARKAALTRLERGRKEVATKPLTELADILKQQIAQLNAAISALQWIEAGRGPGREGNKDFSSGLNFSTSLINLDVSINKANLPRELVSVPE
jgi:hypothetical protein